MWTVILLLRVCARIGYSDAGAAGVYLRTAVMLAFVCLRVCDARAKSMLACGDVYNNDQNN